MREIPLSKRGWKFRGQYVALVDDADYEYLRRFNWRACVQGTAPNVRVYAVRRVVREGRQCDERMHRTVWERHNGPIPEGVEIDHAEPGQLGGLDNRLSNLRLTDKTLNQANERLSINNTSGFKGVWWQKQARMWRADILVRGRKRHIGYFTDKVEAAKAYDAAAREEFGEFARVNFPEAA